MGKNIRDMTIEMLVEIQETNHFSDTKMAAIIDVSVESYRRWKKRICFPNQTIVLDRIGKVVKKYYKAS